MGAPQDLVSFMAEVESHPGADFIEGIGFVAGVRACVHACVCARARAQVPVKLASDMTHGD